MLVTTTSVIEGGRITRYFGIVSGETIIGANVFRDFFASIRDVVGGRSGSYEGVPVPHNLTSSSLMPYFRRIFRMSSLLLSPLMPSTGRRFMSWRTASQSPCFRQWARCILRIMAGSTWLRSRSKLSLGP